MTKCDSMMRIRMFKDKQNVAFTRTEVHDVNSNGILEHVYSKTYKYSEKYTYAYRARIRNELSTSSEAIKKRKSNRTSRIGEGRLF